MYEGYPKVVKKGHVQVKSGVRRNGISSCSNEISCKSSILISQRLHRVLNGVINEIKPSKTNLSN
jgi:hypothetical protein